MIYIEQFTPDDIPELLSWIESPRFLLQATGPMYNYNTLESEMHSFMNIASKNSTGFFYKLIEDSICIGHFELLHVDLRHRNATVGRIILNKDYRGKGYGTVLVREALCTAFETHGLHRIQLQVYDFNESAVKCYEKAGFSLEGTLRDIVRLDGEYWNSYLMSMLEDEYRRLYKEK